MGDLYKMSLLYKTLLVEVVEQIPYIIMLITDNDLTLDGGKINGEIECIST